MTVDDISDPAGIDRGRANGSRTWRIFLKNGEVINFTGDWNTSGAKLREDFWAFQRDGSLPTNAQYRFEFDHSTNAPTSAIIWVDLREVAGISTTFG